MVSGSSGMFTSNRDCTSSSFLASDSVDTNEMDRPLVPNLRRGGRGEGGEERQSTHVHRVNVDESSQLY